MKHVGTKTIETDRLILRRFTMEDAEPMFRNWASDERVTKFLIWPPHANIDVTRMVLNEWVNSYANDNYYQWAIELKELREPIGSISVVHLDDKTMKAHIGYCIGADWWHKGIMSEALKAVIDFMFDEVGMQRVEARHDTNNPHSGDVMRKCGMKYEGTLRKSDWNNQGEVDACYYAILADER